MMNFLRAVWRLIFRGSHGTTQKANAYHPGHVEACQCDKFTGKPKQYFPQKDWRLLARIGYTGTTAKIEQTHDIKLDEDVLERIDFLALLSKGLMSFTGDIHS
jgi:hypothetical protein